MNGLKITRRAAVEPKEPPGFEAGKFYENKETGDLVYAASTYDAYARFDVDPRQPEPYDRNRFALVGIGGANHGVFLNGLARPRSDYREVEVEVIY